MADDNIRVANTDLEALNLTSVYLKDGSGAIASLGVYHALHCLVWLILFRKPQTTHQTQKKIRHVAYRDWYHKGKDELQLVREQKHVGMLLRGLFFAMLSIVLRLLYRSLHRVHQRELDVQT